MIRSNVLGRVHKHLRNLPLLVFAGLMLASGARANSIDAGRSLYVANCVGCHGTPPNAMKINNLVAANRPELIRQQIQINPEMQFLTALTDNDLANIATYLAYPVTTDADCIFGWGETVLPDLLTPRTLSDSGYGYYFRYYTTTQVYLGVQSSPLDGLPHLYYFDTKTGNGILDLGNDSSYLSSALAAACP